MEARGINIVAHRFCSDNEFIAQTMQAYTDDFITLIGYRPQVDILFLTIAPDEFYAYINELIDSIGKGYL